MGRVRSYTVTASPATLKRSLTRAVDCLVGALLLLLALPLMAVAAVAVRLSSHGPVLHREPGLDRDGRRVDLLTFRVMVDGGGTEAHERLRAVIGAAHRAPFTRVGRVLSRTRLERLPWLLNLLAGRTSLFG